MFSSLALLLIISQPSATSTCAADLEAARQAYGTYDVTTARRGYARVSNGPCAAAERAEASTELARILWLVDGNGSAAVARLRAVAVTGPEGCAAAAMLGRVLTQSGRAAEVAAALAHVLPVCAGLDPAVGLAVTGASVAVVAAARSAERPGLASAALTNWRKLDPLAQATLQGSRQRLALALLAGDPVDASLGWRAFFAMGGGISGSQIPPGLDDLLRDGLNPQAVEAARAALCDTLIRAGFADEARRLAEPMRVAGPAWRSAHAYFRMRDRLFVNLTAHDREYASGKRRNDAGLESLVIGIMRDAVAEAGRPTTDLWPAVRALWNLVGTTGRSNGVEGLHLGHVSTDVELSVRQGDREGRVRFVALDNMVANGFSGWLGDGVTGPGGWAAEGRIIQVRTRYVQTALERALIASPGMPRYAYMTRLARLEAADREGPAPVPVRFLPSLSAQLQLAAVDALAGELRRTPGKASAFETRFAALWYARSLDGTILRHEGRHALDQAQFPGDDALGNAELEYRAKLSELEYGASPRVALSNIYGRLLGGDTGHGISNLRLVDELVAWTSAHRSEVTGYDPAMPPLLQLWRVDDRQLRAIASGLDPAGRK